MKCKGSKNRGSAGEDTEERITSMEAVNVKVFGTEAESQSDHALSVLGLSESVPEDSKSILTLLASVLRTPMLTALLFQCQIL